MNALKRYDKIVLHLDYGRDTPARYNVIVDVIAPVGIYGRYQVLPDGHMHDFSGLFPWYEIVYLNRVETF